MSMQGDTQADRLEIMMRRHQVYPTYTLSLPLFEVKKSFLKSLQSGDILLVGLQRLSLVLLDKKGECATVSLDEHNGLPRLMITELKEESETKASKKHQIVSVSFGEFQSRKLEAGHVIGMTDIRFEELSIEANRKKIAQGSLIDVEGKIAVQIDKVL